MEGINYSITSLRVNDSSCHIQTKNTCYLACSWKEFSINYNIASINQEELNPIELEGDLNPNPQNNVAHCSLILTYNQNPIRKFKLVSSSLT